MSAAINGQIPETYSCVNAWAYAITHPSVSVYQKLVNDPLACTRRACIYVAIGSSISLVAASLLQSIIFARATNEFDLSIPAYSFSTIVMFALPFAILASVVMLAVSAYVLQRVARLLGGTGGFSKLAYAFACFAAPIGMIVGIFSSGPVVFAVVLPLLVYAVLLQVIAVKAVNGFQWGKAILTMLIPLAVVALVGGLAAAVLT